MAEMFRFLTGILDTKEQKMWKIYAVLSLISPIVDIFSFSVIIYIINIVVRENGADPKLTAFTFFMVLVSILKCLFELYKSKLANRFVYDGAQKLSMKIYELLIKEDLMEHNKKSAIQAMNTVRNDTTNSIQIITDFIEAVINGITMAGFAGAVRAMAERVQPVLNLDKRQSVGRHPRSRVLSILIAGGSNFPVQIGRASCRERV